MRRRRVSRPSLPLIGMSWILANIYCRSAEEVARRLDGLIQKIYDIQRPNMNGEAKADVVLVCISHLVVGTSRHLHDANITSGSTWAYSPSIRQALAQVSNGNPYSSDDVTRCYRCLKVCCNETGFKAQALI